MMRLAVAARPFPFGMAIELALTTGMRRSEVRALRRSDLNDDGTITVSHTGRRRGRLLPQGAQDPELRPDDTPRQAHAPGPQDHAGRMAPRRRIRPIGPLRPRRAGAGEPPPQPHPARQRLRRPLQDERLSLHLPRPAQRPRHDDDRSGRQRPHGRKLPGPRERVRDPQHRHRRGHGRRLSHQVRSLR